MTTPTSAAWIDIAPVKVELNKTSADDDVALQSKVNAACAEIERIIGHVALATFTATVNVGRDGMVILDETPVAHVDSIHVLAADGTVLQDLGAGTDVDPSGVLYGLPCGTIAISWTAGRTPIPGDMIEAAVQLAAHLWRQSRSLTEGGRVRNDVTVGPGMSSALPNKVRDLLGLTGKANRSAVYVG